MALIEDYGEVEFRVAKISKRTSIVNQPATGQISFKRMMDLWSQSPSGQEVSHGRFFAGSPWLLRDTASRQQVSSAGVHRKRCTSCAHHERIVHRFRSAGAKMESLDWISFFGKCSSLFRFAGSLRPPASVLSSPFTVTERTRSVRCGELRIYGAATP